MINPYLWLHMQSQVRCSLQNVRIDTKCIHQQVTYLLPSLDFIPHWTSPTTTNIAGNLTVAATSDHPCIHVEAEQRPHTHCFLTLYIIFLLNALLCFWILHLTEHTMDIILILYNINTHHSNVFYMRSSNLPSDKLARQVILCKYSYAF